MKTEMLSTRIEPETKAAFIAICNEVGLSPSQAIKLFAKAVINHGGLPFDVKAKNPESVASNAIQQIEKGLGNKGDEVNPLLMELSEGKFDVL